MKKFYSLVLLGTLIPIVLLSFKPESKEKSAPITPQYMVVAWNDLGMHCANLDFSNLCILPPYNNQTAQVIMKGSPAALPVVMSGSSGIYVTYEIPGNTESATKTNFWDYSQQIFGVTLPPNIGLTGAGMSGTMTADPANFYHVTGIPITAFPDATPTVPDPYQLALIKAFSAGNELLASTQSVIPVSHEINCVSAGCHSSELNILQMHAEEAGFNINDKPILCANCHSDNALGAPGQPGIPPFSQVIHEKHGEFINTGTISDCYKCHPGPNTQCWRDVMHQNTGAVTKCQDCHGSVSEVGHSIDQGRNPWLQEPSCGAVSCHGPNFAEEPGKLFRNSRGHGGLFCSTCHGSPHAILPTGVAQDNVQNIALQGFPGTLSDCKVCHGYYPSGPGPHGILNTTVQNVTIANGDTNCYNATGNLRVAGDGTTVAVENGGSATFIAGMRISFLPGTQVYPGGYIHGYITTNGQYCGTPAMPQAGNAEKIEQILRTTKSPVFKVFPNPTTGIFMVEHTGIKTTGKLYAEIYRMQGELLVSKELTGNKTHVLGLSDQPAGVYFVRLISGDLVETVKVIKQ